MNCTNLNFKHARLLSFFSKRKVVDPISWLVFFVLSIAFSALYFILEKPSGMALVDIVIVIIKSSIFYTFFMMIPVYINLNILKKSTIDYKVLRIWTYIPYVIGVLLNALFFAWIF